MTRRKAVLVCIVVAIVVAACGGGGDEFSGRTLTLEAYFAELEGIIDTFGDDVDALREQNAPLLAVMNADVDAFLADEANLPVLQDLIASAERPRILGDALERIEALEPPPEVEDAHDDFVEAGRASRLALEEQYDVVHGAETMAELMELDARHVVPTFAPSALTKACLDLVAIGRDHGLSPAIGCGGLF